MAYRELPIQHQYEDVNGNPAAGYYMLFRIYNTSTPATIYTNSSGSASATNFILNSAGCPTLSSTKVDLFGDTAQSAGYKYRVCYTNDWNDVYLDFPGPIFPVPTSIGDLGTTNAADVDYTTPSGTTVNIESYLDALPIINIDDHGGVSDATTSGRSVSGTDNSAALTAAIAAAVAVGGGKVVAYGPRRYASTVTISGGVTVDFGLSGRPVYNNTTAQWTNTSGNVCFIDHGKGTSADTWASSAFILNEGANIIGGAFVQVAQDMHITTPDTYPPAITTAVGSLINRIQDVNLCNCYVGIDARRDHGNLQVKGVIGYCLYRAIRTGSGQDNDLISDVHMNPQYAYTGSVLYTNSVVDWCFDNGALLEVGANSYSEFRNLFGYNYLSTVIQAYQANDAGNGINYANKGIRESKFYNIRGDSCKNVMTFSSASGSGVVNYGIDIYGLSGNLKSAYNAASKKGVSLLTWTGNATEQGGFRVFGGRVAQADADVFVVTYSRGSEIHGFDWYDFANSTSTAVGARLNNTIGFKIIGGDADLQGRTSARLLKLETGNTRTLMTGVTVRDHGGVVTIDDNTGGNANYHIVDNIFDAAATQTAVIDNEGDINSVIKNNNSDNTYYILSDANVDGSGILSIPVDEQWDGLIRYTGTTTINGLTVGRRGRRVTIRTTASCTITDDSGSATGAQILRMAGNFSATANDTITFVADNDAWYEMSRSAN